MSAGSMQRAVILKDSEGVNLFHERQDLVGRQQKNVNGEDAGSENMLLVNSDICGDCIH